MILRRNILHTFWWYLLLGSTEGEELPSHVGIRISKQCLHKFEKMEESLKLVQALTTSPPPPPLLISDWWLECLNYNGELNNLEDIRLVRLKINIPSYLHIFLNPQLHTFNVILI